MTGSLYDSGHERRESHRGTFRFLRFWPLVFCFFSPVFLGGVLETPTGFYTGVHGAHWASRGTPTVHWSRKFNTRFEFPWNQPLNSLGAPLKSGSPCERSNRSRAWNMPDVVLGSPEIGFHASSTTSVPAPSRDFRGTSRSSFEGPLPARFSGSNPAACAPAKCPPTFSSRRPRVAGTCG